MPNWVNNNLTITGDAARVQEVKNQLASPYERTIQKHGAGGLTVEVVTVEKNFSFWNITRPEGEDLARYNESLLGGSPSPFWYDWNCNNWGTKWDTDAELTEHDSGHLQYVFDTAWSPPVEALVALGKKYDDVHIELEWEEEQGFGGAMRFDGGCYEVLNEYDIPGSHEEMYERKGYCHCEGYDEKVFSDCPIEEIEDADRIPEDELEIEVLV